MQTEPYDAELEQRLAAERMEADALFMAELDEEDRRAAGRPVRGAPAVTFTGKPQVNRTKLAAARKSQRKARQKQQRKARQGRGR